MITSTAVPNDITIQLFTCASLTVQSLSQTTTTTMASNTSTRKRTNSLPTSDIVHNLPPKRAHSQSLRRDINPPLVNTRLSTLIYILVGLTALLTAYFSYRSVQYKSQEWNGWLHLLLQGRSSPETRQPAADPGAVQQPANSNIESHVVALAAALGIPTHELASAIAGAVRSYVPPASLSSIKAHETGDVVSVLLQAPQPTVTSNEKGRGAWEAASTAAGVVEELAEDFAEGVESFVGMDEP